MKKQIPHGDDDLVCPFHKKSQAQVCHKCPFWMQLRGKNKNTGEDIDEWKCAVAMLPVLLIETAYTVRHADATLQEMRNENEKAHQEQKAMAAIAVQRASATVYDTIRHIAGGMHQVTPDDGSGKRLLADDTDTVSKTRALP